jgi:predicted nucleic acid-binding protein
LAETLYLTATSFSELLVGIEILPDGKHKQELSIALKELLIKLFGPRILPFDQQAAIAYAPLIGRAKLGGGLQSISVADGQIAAIASVHGFTIAQRETSPLLLPLECPYSIHGNNNTKLNLIFLQIS